MVRKIILLIFALSAAISSACAQTGTWSGSLDVPGTKLSLVFHLDEENPTMDSPDQGVKGVPIQIEKPGAGKINIKIPSIGARYEGIWTFKNIVGTFTQMNTAFPLTLTPGENKPKRPQTPAEPFPYTTEEVTFSNGGICLNGTLTLPENYTRETPVLIMITGSGQQNRDEELFEHKPFAVIADVLARAGFATLRYDDRGFEGYEGDIYDCTIDDFKNDALAGIDLLRGRFDKVGVLGHSEGGTIAIMIAAEGKADFIISLAGMSISGAETLVWQNRLALKGAGLPDETVDTYCDLIKEAFNVRVHGGIMPDPKKSDLPEALLQNYYTVVSLIQKPYMTDFLSTDMRPLLNKINCPILALNGTKDNQVDHQSNLDALRNGLPSNMQNKIEAIVDANHLFQHCSTGAVTEYRNIEETISPEVLKIIVLWLSALSY